MAASPLGATAETEHDGPDVYDPSVEYDDPIEAERARTLSLTPEQRAVELNDCSARVGVIAYWTAERGEVVRDVGAERQAARIAAAWRGYDRRRVLAIRIMVVRPPVRVRDRGRARRGRRTTLRRSPARSPGREPEPASRPLEAAA